MTPNVLDKLNLDGKTVIVTGGGTGLGREMVLALARAGADVVVAGRRTGPIEETAGLAREGGTQAVAVPTDVTDSAQVRRLCDGAVDRFGKVDALVNTWWSPGGARRHGRRSRRGSDTAARKPTNTLARSSGPGADP